MKRLYYIGERHNPQFPKPYYKMYGQLYKKEVKAKENCLYGSMRLTGYATEEEYLDAIKQLREAGYSVH